MIAACGQRFVLFRVPGFGADAQQHDPTGQTVELGDRVSLGEDATGIVVADLDAGVFHNEYPEEQWGYLKRGVVIKFESYGVVHHEEEIEQDLNFIARTKN